MKRGSSLLIIKELQKIIKGRKMRKLLTHVAGNIQKSFTSGIEEIATLKFFTHNYS